MSDTVISTSLTGWAENLPGSLYLYTAVGGFLLVILAVALWLLIRKPKSQANVSSKNTTTLSPLGHLPVSVSAIYDKIASVGGVNKSILLAGAGLEQLPVTIPVGTAVQLAQAGKKVLLIDLDTRRNAAAKVFDLNESVVKNCARPKPLPSSVDNLSLWPAEFFVRFGQMNLRTVVQSAAEHFEFILIYAPYLDGHPDRKLIASCAKYGLIFCKTTQQFERLQKLLAQGECRLLEQKAISC